MLSYLEKHWGFLYGFMKILNILETTKNIINSPYFSKTMVNTVGIFSLLLAPIFIPFQALAESNVLDDDYKNRSAYFAMGEKLVYTKLETQEILKLIPTIISTGTSTVTAYSSTIGQTDSSPFTTANGTHVKDGIIAANFLPFGTKVQFPELFGNKVFTVEDRMNARYYKKFDIWFAEHNQAKQFGAKYLTYHVVE